jgi:putative peptidoglycan lipid II flippase
MFAPILNNLVVIAAFVAYAIMRGHRTVSPSTITLGEKLVLAIGTTAGVVAMTVALWPSLRATGYRWHPKLDARHPAVRKLAKLALWVIVYVVANQVAYLVVIVLSSRTGGYAAYAAAFILFQLPHAIVAVSIFTALLPGMSGRAAAGDREGVLRALSQGLRATAFVVLPAAVGYVALAPAIVRLLLQHGATTATDTALIARTLRAFAVGLVFFSAFQLLSRTYYALQDSRTPALVNVAAATLNIAVDLLLVLGLHLGIAGLAFGHATTYVFSTIVCLVLLRRRLGGLDGHRIGVALARIVPAALLSGAAAWLAAVAAGHAVTAVTLTGEIVQVASGVGAGLLVYAGATFIFGIEEADDLREVVVRRFRR